MKFSMLPSNRNKCLRQVLQRASKFRVKVSYWLDRTERLGFILRYHSEKVHKITGLDRSCLMLPRTATNASAKYCSVY